MRRACAYITRAHKSTKCRVPGSEILLSGDAKKTVFYNIIRLPPPPPDVRMSGFIELISRTDVKDPI